VRHAGIFRREAALRGKREPVVTLSELYHENIKLRRPTIAAVAGSSSYGVREMEAMARAYKRYRSFPQTPLPPIPPDLVGPPIADVIAARRSSRNFVPGQLDLTEISAILQWSYASPLKLGSPAARENGFAERHPPAHSIRLKSISACAPSEVSKQESITTMCRMPRWRSLSEFPATQFPDFCLCRRAAVFMTILGCLSLHPKIPFPAVAIGREFWTALNPKFRRQGPVNRVWDRRSSYSGFSPSVSNCRLHSVGGSRSRSIPTPRGRRPSTAALTRLGARKASEMVMLTCRTLHFSRTQSSATVVIRPETASSSH
jgi:hypothetical protein